jgi:hypothetical protein
VTILVASLIAPPFLDDRRRWGSWLENHEEIRASVPDTNVDYYCAVELDGRGMEPYFDAGWTRAAAKAGVYFETFTYGSGRTKIDTETRLKHICMGRNMIAQYAIQDPNVTHILGLDGDVAPPPDILPNLLRVDYPLVAARIPTYCMRGPRIVNNPRNESQVYPASWKVEDTQMSSAGAWLIERQVFKSLRWRTDPTLGLSDDPAYLHDIKNVLGVDPPILQRGDTIALHWPPAIGPIETRLADPSLTPVF